MLESLHRRIAYLAGLTVHIVTDEARRTGVRANSLLNQARRQTIPAFRERGIWKIGIDDSPLGPTVAMLDRLLGAAGYRLDSRLVRVDEVAAIAGSRSKMEPRSGLVEYPGAAGREISRPRYR